MKKSFSWSALRPFALLLTAATAAQAQEPSPAEIAAQQLASAQGETRWCGTGGSNQELSRNPLLVNCDGFTRHGYLRAQAPLLSLSVSYWVANAERHVQISLPNTTANDLVTRSPAFRARLKAAVAAKDLAADSNSSLHINAIEVSPREQVFESAEGHDLAKPDLPAPLRHIPVSGVYAKEFSCLAAWSKVEGNDHLAVSAGSATQSPLVMVRAAGKPGARQDIVLSADGYWVNRYPQGMGSHVFNYEIAGPTAQSPSTYILTDFAEREDGSGGWGALAFSGQPWAFERAPKIKFDLANRTVGGRDDDIQAALQTVIEASRAYRRDFDRNSRYQSKANLRVLARALEACQSVAALHPKDPTKMELDSFEKYIFPKGRQAYLSSPGAIAAEGGHDVIRMISPAR